VFPEPILCLHQVTRQFSPHIPPAIDSLSLVLQPGELLALLGSSGCGKTTLLRLIAGFESPQSGTITIAQQLVAGAGDWVAPERRQVGMVFQDYALFPHLTVWQNVEFGLSRKKPVVTASRVKAAIALVGLEDIKVKIGKYGAYIQVTEGDKQVSATIPQDLTPSDLLPDKIEFILKQKLEGPDRLGTHPETGEPIFMLVGQYGAYVQLGEATEAIPKPKRASIAKGVALEQVTLAMAVELLRMPRDLGVHPETGKKIEANLGRFGPYVAHKKGGAEGKDDFRSLKGDDDPYTVTLERAVELLSQPKAVRTGGAKVLRSLGLHPADEEPVEILSGKYGNYVKHGKVNATLPKDRPIEEVTLAEAIAILSVKEPAKSKSKKTTTKSATKSTAKTKAAAKSKATSTAKATKTTKAKKSTVKANV